MSKNKRFQWVYIKDNTLELSDNGSVKVFNNERLEELLNNLNDENEQLKKEDELFFGKVFDILLKYQDLFNREMADEVLEELGIELTKWFE